MMAALLEDGAACDGGVLSSVIMVFEKEPVYDFWMSAAGLWKP